MESSYDDLRSKQVINIVDGKMLGRITDIIFDLKSGKILGIVLPPQTKNFFSLFKSGNELFVPFNNICKIGVDAILVELYLNAPPAPQQSQAPPKRLN